MRRGLFLCAVASLLLVGAEACRRGGRHRARRREQVSWGAIDPAWNPSAISSVRGVSAQVLRDTIQQRLTTNRPSTVGPELWKRVVQLYGHYSNAPLWLDGNGALTDRAASLTAALASADSDALDLSRYPLGDLRRALQALRTNSQPSVSDLARLDVLLTTTFAALGQDLLTGQVDPRTMSQDWHISTRAEDVDSALAGVLRTERLDASLALVRPPQEEYSELRRQLQKYGDLVARGGWSRVPEGRSRKPGEKESANRLAALRQRLSYEGFLGPGSGAPSGNGQTSDPEVYDRELAGAVAQYQAHHGIVVDSILGSETVTSMNVSAAYRLGQLAANLERYRWLPRHLGSDYILVNVPAFRLTAYDSTGPALEMKVIVGAEYEDKNTPVFSDTMQYVVFRPYWNVTDQIAEKEIYPKITTDSGFMERNNYEFFRDGGKQWIRQRPGPKNSLGLVKFLFPNDFNIYLHDTPDEHLFAKDVRAFSHGCIRLEKPAELAQWVLGWTPEEVRQAMQDGPDNKTITLDEKIPVYIVYFTTYIRDSQLFFGNDLYKRDDKLVERVKTGAMSSQDVGGELADIRRLVSK